ncbi:hypothetical protein XENOCAPTIV_002619, partial [Xenoophorus captivus]
GGKGLSVGTTIPGGGALVLGQDQDQRGTTGFLSPDCPRLETAVPHLHASSVEVSPGAQVHLSCDPGFYLIGEPVLQCQNKGEWSHPLPICKSKAQN